MIVLAHRGWWTDPADKNSPHAIKRAFVNGFGVETDIRDLDGRIVVSHDMPKNGPGVFDLEELLSLYADHGRGLPLALNIKSDGLGQSLLRMLNKVPSCNYFVFDMSIPDAVACLRVGLRVFGRRSDVEPTSALDERVDGFWLDSLICDEVPTSLILECVGRGKPVALVSPELHGRRYRAVWGAWANLMSSLEPSARERFMVCTDFPDEAANVLSMREASMKSNLLTTSGSSRP